MDSVFGALWFVIVAVLAIIPAWRILVKAGFAGAWSLLLLVPVVNVLATWVFAFKRWPVEDKNRLY